MSSKEWAAHLKRHLMTGVSYMIPVVAIGGMFYTLGTMFGEPAAGSFLAVLRDLGRFGLDLIVPVIAAFIAFSIGERPAIAPGLITGLLADKMGTGFLGGLIVGLLVGYLVLQLKRLSVVPNIGPALTILVIPIVTTLAVGLLLYFVIGAPIAAITAGLTGWLDGLQGGNAVLMAAVLGGMMAFDMGGPVNKTALTFAFAVFAEESYVASSAVFIAIAIPPLGLALATFLAPEKYTVEEREAGRSAVLLGILGITEGAIPFALADPLRVIPSIVIGTALTSALATAFRVVNPTVIHSVLAIPLVNKPLLHLAALVAGILATALLVNLLKKEIPAD